MNLIILSIFFLRLFSDGIGIKWDRNSETDLSGYKLHIGTQSAIYDSIIDVGNVTDYRLSNLKNSTTYFFAVSAYDSALNESELSNELAIFTTFNNSDTLSMIDFSQDSLNRIDINDLIEYHRLFRKYLGRTVIK